MKARFISGVRVADIQTSDRPWGAGESQGPGVGGCRGPLPTALTTPAGAQALLGRRARSYTEPPSGNGDYRLVHRARFCSHVNQETEFDFHLEAEGSSTVRAARCLFMAGTHTGLRGSGTTDHAAGGTAGGELLDVVGSCKP